MGLRKQHGASPLNRRGSGAAKNDRRRKLRATTAARHLLEFEAASRRLLSERPRDIRVLAFRDVGLPTWHLTMNGVKLTARVDSCSTSCPSDRVASDCPSPWKEWPSHNRICAVRRATLTRRVKLPIMCGGLTRIQVAAPDGTDVLFTPFPGDGRAQTLTDATVATVNAGTITVPAINTTAHNAAANEKRSGCGPH
ncbi:hypothetical protein DYB26_011288 [Aphanomyces astaci]|uniref:Uncharacterized protein n=1 Tax=Aphanomyces astaci TaxID=112090 RepID=A0A397DGZ9_APHAT|nr:hypothetical protein DYB38_013176 [Aphanomyces astaci]RHZ18548.1 hypothetical protein DYB26_011288 [Aphanomyces astaci]